MKNAEERMTVKSLILLLIFIFFVVNEQHRRRSKKGLIFVQLSWLELQKDQH